MTLETLGMFSPEATGVGRQETRPQTRQWGQQACYIPALLSPTMLVASLGGAAHDCPPLPAPYPLKTA